MKPAHVIGAGLSGLAAAWHLADRGFAVTVIDAGPAARRPDPDTVRPPHGLVETAANAFVWDEVGGRVVSAPRSQRRYFR